MGNYPRTIAFTDWTQRLLISGLGNEQCIVCFGGGNNES